MTLPRLQRFELEDQPWFPRTVRDLATGYLHFVRARLDMHRPAAPLLAEALRRSGAARVVDLCAGGAGPVPALAGALHTEGLDVPFVLTDLYPNLPAFAEASAGAAAAGVAAVTWVTAPVDARAVPAALTGLRTVFNAFHHFRPADAVAALRDAARQGQPIAVFEYPNRRLRLLPAFAFLTPLAVLAVTPWIRPFRWQRLAWTYLLPLVPLACWWDGLVSTLRAYTPEELAGLAAEVGVPGYQWRTGRVAVASPPSRLTYPLGCPATGADARVA